MIGVGNINALGEGRGTQRTNLSIELKCFMKSIQIAKPIKYYCFSRYQITKLSWYIQLSFGKSDIYCGCFIIIDSPNSN